MFVTWVRSWSPGKLKNHFLDRKNDIPTQNGKLTFLNRVDKKSKKYGSKFLMFDPEAEVRK
jgi:hypothetical protein